jgi:PKD repeat protein
MKSAFHAVARATLLLVVAAFLGVACSEGPTDPSADQPELQLKKGGNGKGGGGGGGGSENQAPTADPGGPYDGESGQAIQFMGSGSFDPDGPNGRLSYAWDFGDGASASERDPLHVYSATGLYTVTLTVTDRKGLASSPAQTTADVADPPDPPPPPPGGGELLIGAGDIARCADSGDEDTAALIDQYPAATVFTAGDNAYESGTTAEYANCYDPSWGRHKARTRPTPGNHEYVSSGAQPYFDYFGAAAGEAGKGYYSYDLGSWHIVALNSSISRGAGSAQVGWLDSDLAASSASCTLAYWHHPRFSSGTHGNNSSVGPFWDVLFQRGAEVVINGHDHDYERFAPQNPSGLADASSGIREFVVGTGGKSLRSFDATKSNSEFRYNQRDGVIKLTLYDGGYDWEFISTDGVTRDSGSGTCH